MYNPLPFITEGTAEGIALDTFVSNCHLRGLAAFPSDVKSFISSPKKIFNLNRAFYGGDFTSLDLRGLDTSLVGGAYACFQSNFSLTSLSIDWDLRACTSLNSFCNDCQALASLTLGISTSNALTNVSQMFYRCGQLDTLDVSMIDVSGVTEANKIEYVFSGCSSLRTLKLNETWLNAVIPSIHSLGINYNVSGYAAPQTILVPSAYVETFKSSAVWSPAAAYIQGY